MSDTQLPSRWTVVSMLVVSTAAVLLPVAAGAAEKFEVPLTVRESAGVARRAEPISGGVPLPAGRFQAGQAFAIFRPDGSRVPAQVVPLVVELDQSLRWVLVDFQDDIAAGATNRYVLRPVPPPADPQQDRTIGVHETDDAVTVDTGAIRFTISRKKPFSVLDMLSVRGRDVVTGGEATYTQLLGRGGWDDKSAWKEQTFTADAPESVRVWYTGAKRLTVEVRGHFAGDPAEAGYRAWITAWGGSSRLHVKYKLCNSNPDRYTAILVKDSCLKLRLAGGGGKAQCLLGATKPLQAGSDGWIEQGLTARAGAGFAKAGSGKDVLWTAAGEKDIPAGWIARGGVFVCDRLFAGNPARRLAFAGGQLVLTPIAERYDGPKDSRGRLVGQPWQAKGFWLYDCSHHSSEYLFDFAAGADPAALDAEARASRDRLWVLAPGEYYSACQAVSTGEFGTLADEEACYKKWGWAYEPKQVPAATQPQGDAFIPWEDNHYESEADSVEGLLLMYLRTGQRGWLDQGEAWARYHMDLEVWRTDEWLWKDGAIWFPQGGPQGNRRVREKWNFTWGPDWGDRKDSVDCRDLWRHSQAKSCYCHYYGGGLADYFCLTGDRDALAAAIDNAETKDSEFRRSGKYEPGKTPVGSIRGFGRGFQVLMRTLAADPGNELIANLVHLCAKTLWQSPLIDERGFHCSSIGGGYGGMKATELTPKVLKWMDEQGITVSRKGDTVDTLSRGGKTWPVRCYGGTWMHVYVQNGADLYARRFDDDNMRDFTIAFAEMCARFMRSRKCHQTWYYAFFDVPELGKVFDPWAFEHTDTTDGVGCKHSGWYTRFHPDACAKGFSWTGEKGLLDEARLFWSYGSRRQYQTTKYTCGPDHVGMFASHKPPKDDQVLSVSRLLYEASHGRADGQPPAAVGDLKVKLLGGGKAEVSFTAPTDAGGGKVARYQVKCDALPIVPYEQWDFARDSGQKRNWWRAVNCQGEVAPSAPGSAERFTVTGVPDAAGGKLHFAVRSFDDSSNRSALSNLAAAGSRE